MPPTCADGIEGFVLPLPKEGEGKMIDDGLSAEDRFVHALHRLADDPTLRKKMGKAGIKRAAQQHSSRAMVASYRALMRSMTPPKVLLDMDGVIVDWDKGFLERWAGRSKVDRTYYK